MYKSAKHINCTSKTQEDTPQLDSKKEKKKKEENWAST